jgi:gluconate 2-dehydrogenase gamma chain
MQVMIGAIVAQRRLENSMSPQNDRDEPCAATAAPGPAPDLGRRRLVLGGALAGVGTAVAGIGGATALHDGELGAPPETFRGEVPWVEGSADVPPAASGTDYLFFSPDEASFIIAALSRLIPDDEVGPGAVEADVPVFLDRQLAGRYGNGDHFFLGGPWPKGTPEQGYQGRYTPAQFYRAAIAAVDSYVAAGFHGLSFSRLPDADRDAVLKGLEGGVITLGDGVDGKGFFALLLQNTREGYFADPLYGGNKDMGAWKMIGFPGAHYNYTDWIRRHGERVPFAPVGLKGRPGWTVGSA